MLEMWFMQTVPAVTVLSQFSHNVQKYKTSEYCYKNFKIIIEQMIEKSQRKRGLNQLLQKKF